MKFCYRKITNLLCEHNNALMYYDVKVVEREIRNSVNDTQHSLHQPQQQWLKEIWKWMQATATYSITILFGFSIRINKYISLSIVLSTLS